MLRNVPSEFMNSDIYQNTIHNLAESIEKIASIQQELGKMYKYMCDCFLKEMNKYLELKNVNPKSRKLLKFSKPYWNDNLTVLWFLEKYV